MIFRRPDGSFDILVWSPFGVGGKIFCTSDAHGFHIDHLLNNHSSGDYAFGYRVSLDFPLTSSPTNIEIEGSRKSCSCFCSPLGGNRGVSRRQKIPSQRGNRNRKCHFFLPWFSQSSSPSQRRPENQRRRNHRRRRILGIGKKYRRKLDTTIL